MNNMETAREIVKNAINNLNDLLEENEKIPFSDDVQLYGDSCLIDSMDRVNLVIDIEKDLEEKLGREIELMADKRFSQSNEENPFYTVKSLIVYIAELLGE